MIKLLSIKQVKSRIATAILICLISYACNLDQQIKEAEQARRKSDSLLNGFNKVNDQLKKEDSSIDKKNDSLIKKMDSLKKISEEN